jgi:hypothetical protein
LPVARPVISLALPFVCCVLFRVLSRICAMSDVYPLALLPKARWWLEPDVGEQWRSHERCDELLYER